MDEIVDTVLEVLEIKKKRAVSARDRKWEMTGSYQIRVLLAYQRFHSLRKASAKDRKSSAAAYHRLVNSNDEKDLEE
jgi:hypothetical protein